MKSECDMDKQDKVERGLYVFGQPVPFKDAFPMLSDLRAHVQIRTGGPLDERPQERHFSLEYPPGEYVRCPKPGCTDGGWCIADVIREMVAKKETQRKSGGICTGRQRMGRSNFRECLTHFMADITIRYKETSVEPSKG